jgi:hypothetical protein
MSEVALWGVGKTKWDCLDQGQTMVKMPRSAVMGTERGWANIADRWE